MHSTDLLETLKSFDTPTICNALEIVVPERRLTGFTAKPLVCPFPDLPPIVGYARTATIRTVNTPELTGKDARAQRIGYYEYVASKPGPTITVIQDLDGADVGFGAFWGEVQSAVHKGARVPRCRDRRLHPGHPPVGARLPSPRRLDRAEPCARAPRRLRQAGARRGHAGSLR